MTPLPAPAQYLLRVDDLCPTMHAGRWKRLRDIILESSAARFTPLLPGLHR